MSARGIVAVLVGVVVVGCLSRPYPERQRFVLQVERPGLPSVDAPPPGTSLAVAEGEVLRVGRVRVSPLFERRRFVYRTAEGRFEEDFFHEFFVPPGTILQRETRNWLAASGLFPTVLRSGDPGAADWLLEARVTELYGDRRAEPRAVLSIEFSLLDDRSGSLTPVLRRAYSEQVGVERGDPEGFQAGWGDALARILAALEADLRRELAVQQTVSEEPAG
ncbi:MAG: ABC-type transport auxiliary lipoprotein family protein [Myxococcota bacterium]